MLLDQIEAKVNVPDLRGIDSQDGDFRIAAGPLPSCAVVAGRVPI
jgi:hypothetical protein